MSRSFVLRRHGPSTNEVNKVQQSCLVRRETEAVEIDLDMSTAMSRASWLIGTDPANGRQVSAGLPCKKTKKKTGQADLMRIVCTKLQHTTAALFLPLT
jgi:hypothetical protein